ncbi:MAG TPA: MFS transporter [Kofleriaceae bacterium]
MRLGPTTSFYLLASIILFFLAGSSAPTPLYAVYQAEWGFSPITITVVFGIYAVAVLAMLLVVGSLSDHVGRRPVLLVATLVQAATMIVFATAHGVPALIVARIMQGLATGAAAGAIGAGMIDLDRARGTTANAIAPLLGTATGALLAGVLVQFLPAPTVLVYAVLAGIYVVQFVGVLRMPETVTPRPGALASLRPHLRVPARLHAAMWIAMPALVAAWALAGFYGSLGPLLVRRLLASQSVMLGGLALFVLAASGAAAVYLMRERPARSMLAIGTVALAGGVALTLAAIPTGSALAFFSGAVIAGGGFGGTFQGAIRMVVPQAEPHERAGVLSIVYIIAYLAMGVPAVLGGVRAVHGGGVFTTAREYGVSVMVLALAAFAGVLLHRAPGPILRPSFPPRR